MVAFKTLTISGLKISNIVTCSGKGEVKKPEKRYPREVIVRERKNRTIRRMCEIVL